MRTADLLSELGNRDIKLWSEGGRLRFDAPEGALTPDLREELLNRKAEILALLQRADAITGPVALPLEPVPRDRPLALSFAQQRLWFLDQLEPGQSAFNVSLAVKLTGVLDVAALEQTLSAIVERHEVLRTTYASDEGGEPVQVIATTGTVELEHVDLAILAATERDAELQRQMDERVNRPFDLAAGPLLRATLYRLAPEEHALGLTIHHIAFDGWSFGVLTAELAAFYRAFVERCEPALPALTVQYADYAAWQRQWLQGQALEAQLEYWRQQLGPDLPALELPTDRPRPAQQTFAGAREKHLLPATLLNDLRSLSQREGVTLFMTLTAGLKVLFHRYSGQSIISIGTPVANRTRSELESLIGFFVNSLVLSTELDGELSFREALARVRETSLGAYAHQDLPFEKLVEALKPERDPSRHPIFQVMFALQNVPIEAMELPGLQLGALPVGRSSSQFDLTLSARESEAGLGMIAEYNTDLFGAETVRRLLRHFETLLAGAVSVPDRPISRLPLLNKAERKQLLVEWNDTESAYPRNASLHELFNDQAALTPNAVAVVAGDQALTYAELNSRADQLAQYLRHVHGVGPETCVGLCIERSPEMVVAMLGIIKAGGAYVPLDPDTPSDRLAFMLQDAGVSRVLTQQALKDQLPPDFDGSVIDLDTERDKVSRTPSPELKLDVTADNLAYVMYTSGSTGQPKGIGIPQRAVIRLVLETDYIDLGSTDVVAQASNVAFDAATFELWGALLNGSQLVIIPKTVVLSPRELAAHLQHHRVTTLFLTTALFNHMAREAPEAFRDMRQILFGGESADPMQVAEVLGTAPPQRLLHVYGPTESTTFATCNLTTSVQSGATTVPIGRAIANTQIYVLDSTMQPLPVGVYGEMYIGGDGLARNYLRQPALTAEQFVPNPFSDTAGARLYRTGDLARFLPDGAIEFQGRVDFQVKLRGFRIELGEIEAALCQHPDVQDAIVIVREDDRAQKRLVGYFLSPDEAVSPSDLREYLGKTLPEYMVPALLMQLDAWPLTPNGKVERRALPDPGDSWVDLSEDFVAPRTPIEETLAKIWAELLGVGQVGVHANFFELGGHSLLATQVISRVRERLQVEVPLRHLFEGPTVESLAEFVEQRRQAGGTALAAPLVPCSRTEPLPLSFAQQRLWFLEQLEPGSTAYSMPSAVRLRGALNVPVLRRSLNELVQRHESLRTIFAQGADEPVQVILPTLELPVPLVDLQSRPAAEREDEMRRLRAQEAREPFDLAVGPLFRAQVIRMEAEDHVLLLTFHHVISDGWSMGIFFRELEIIYQALSKSQTPALPPLPVQHADYAVWQREVLQGERLEQEVDYWREYLQGPLPILQLPTDFPRPGTQSHRGARDGVMLGAELQAGLHALSQRSGTTLFMTLLAIFQSLVHRWSGQDDICVGFPSAGRTRAETEGLIGFFINTLTVRTRLAADSDFQDLLDQVKAGVLRGQGHETVPFEKLVEVLQPTRDLARTPVFQIMFNMVPGAMHPFSLPGVTAEAVGHREPESKFDLTLYVQEAEAGIGLSLVYNADLFRPERIKSFLQQFILMAEQVVVDPTRPVAAYSLVTTEAAALLPDPHVALPAPDQARVHDLVTRWAAKQPEDGAITQGGRSWTYRELAERSTALGAELRDVGVDTGTVVGVYGRPTFGLIVSLLGVLHSGGVLVLVDPALPASRRRLMLRHAGAQLLLSVGSEKHDLAWLDEGEGLPVIRVACDSGAVIPVQTIDRLEVDGGPSSVLPLGDAAYIFFSSGTTGVPKAIVGSHQSLGHFIAWQRETYGIGPTDRVAQLTGLSFDAVLRDVFLPLTSGGVLCLPDEVPDQDGEQILHWLEREQITVLHTVPTVAESWLSQAPTDVSLKTLRWVFFSGEPLRDGLINTLRETFPKAGHLVNFYGATETTLIKCYYEIPDAPHPGVQPVEKSLPQTQALVLNADQQLCGVGELGEIVIRTPFRSLGYLIEQGEMSSPFRPNPHREEETGGLYFTGDLGRYRPDGLLDILGRRDDQVKIRGVRIEPNEVMQALGTHPAVHTCFVMAREGVEELPTLVAYVVLTADRSPTVAELRTHLAQQLPAAMIPGGFVFLEALPYTPNGKVDRRALPDPGTEGERQAVEFVAPRTNVEAVTVEIWQDVLQLDRVGIHDDFFGLGGHSLLAAQVMARLRDRFALELPLLRLFETPTVAGLAELIETIHVSDQAAGSHGDALADELEEGEL